MGLDEATRFTVTSDAQYPMMMTPPSDPTVDHPLPKPGARAIGIVYAQLLMGILQGLLQLFRLPLFLFSHQRICDQMTDLIQSSSDVSSRKSTTPK